MCCTPWVQQFSSCHMLQKLHLRGIVPRKLKLKILSEGNHPKAGPELSVMAGCSKQPRPRAGPGGSTAPECKENKILTKPPVQENFTENTLCRTGLQKHLDAIENQTKHRVLTHLFTFGAFQPTNTICSLGEDKTRCYMVRVSLRLENH